MSSYRACRSSLPTPGEAARVGKRESSPPTMQLVAGAQRMASGGPRGQDPAFLPGWAVAAAWGGWGTGLRAGLPGM